MLKVARKHIEKRVSTPAENILAEARLNGAKIPKKRKKTVKTAMSKQDEDEEEDTAKYDISHRVKFLHVAIKLRTAVCVSLSLYCTRPRVDFYKQAYWDTTTEGKALLPFLQLNPRTITVAMIRAFAREYRDFKAVAAKKTSKDAKPCLV